MWVIRVFFACVLVAYGLIVYAAQSQAPPVAPPKPEPVLVVSELDALRLDKAVLSIENARIQIENFQLRILQLQEQLRTATTEAQALMKSLEKPGFTLMRQANGTWMYQKVAVDPPKAIKPPS